MDFSTHSVNRYRQRASYKDYFEARKNLENHIDNGMIFTYDELIEKFKFEVKYKKGDTYIVWYDNRVRDYMVGVQSDDFMIKTVLPETFYIPKRSRFAYA